MPPMGCFPSIRSGSLVPDPLTAVPPLVKQPDLYTFIAYWPGNRAIRILGPMNTVPV